MKQTTKYILGIATASALIISATSGVFAHGGFGPGWGGHQGMMGGPGGMMGGPGGMMGGPGRMGGGPGMKMGGDPVAYTDQHLTQLKTTLAITPEQEATWNTYAEALKAKAGLMTSHRQAMFNGTVSPEQRQGFHQQGFAQMQKVNEAGNGLYAVLTPEQQAKAGNLTGTNCRRW